MGEAVISRAGGSGGDAYISNDTKSALGLNNSASLDDVIGTLALKDPSYATMIVSVVNPDGTIPKNPVSVIMTEANTNKVLNYKTNANGQVIFKTNAGMVNIKEDTFNDYVDLQAGSITNQPALVGEVYKINLVREPKKTVNITKNSNVQFSSACTGVDVHCYGSGGGGGSGWIGTMDGLCVYIKNMVWNVYRYASPKTNFGGDGGRGLYNKKCIKNIESDTNYQIFIGSGGSGRTYYGSWYYKNCSDNDEYVVLATDVFVGVTNGYNGNAGGIVSFSNIVSANGGAGGVYATSSGSGANGYGGNGASGGSGGNGGVAVSSYVISSGRLNVGAASVGWGGSYGKNGYVILNNFSHKNIFA